MRVGVPAACDRHGHADARSPPLPGVHNNRSELEKLDSLMHPLIKGNLASISDISICGYASPDGTYKDNEILASNRARCFKEYMCATYAPGHGLYKVSSVPEDWDGLVELQVAPVQSLPVFAEQLSVLVSLLSAPAEP